MTTKGTRWTRHLTDEQAENLGQLLEGFDLDEEDLLLPPRPERVSVTINVTPAFQAYLAELARDYGLRSPAEVARTVVLGWAKTADHPKRPRRARLAPSDFR